MPVGLSVVGVGLNSWGERGRSWEQRSSSSAAVWLSSFVFSSHRQKMNVPTALSLFQASNSLLNYHFLQPFL